MATRKASGSLLEQVRANLPQLVRRCWVNALPADTRAELEAIREDWKAGRLGPTVTKTGLARAIAVTLVERGLACHASTVCRWLDG